MRLVFRTGIGVDRVPFRRRGLLTGGNPMNTQLTGATIGVGDYRKNAPFSELKVLILEGERVMKARGLEGEELHRASHIYARTMIHFYGQSGWQPLSKGLENEFVDRVIAELAVSHRSHHHSTALTTRQFSTGVTLYDPRMDGLEPFTPATLPDTSPHPHPRTPEEFVEPLPSPIIDEHETKCCVIPAQKLSSEAIQTKHDNESTLRL